ncbi:MAG: hypothetical protein Q9204_007153 [Flavoplaca sp. TL-2023a]
MRSAEILVLLNLLFSFTSAAGPGRAGPVAAPKPGSPHTNPNQRTPHVNQPPPVPGRPPPPPENGPAVSQGGMVTSGGISEDSSSDASTDTRQAGDQGEPTQNQNPSGKNQPPRAKDEKPPGGSGGGTPSDGSSSGNSPDSSDQDQSTSNVGQEPYKFPEEPEEQDSSQDTTVNPSVEDTSTSRREAQDVVKHKFATPVAPTLMSAGYWNCSGLEKIEVVANEIISNRFCRAASVVENCERALANTSCVKSNPHNPTRLMITPAIRAIVLKRTSRAAALKIATPAAAHPVCQVMNQRPERVGPSRDIRIGAAHVAPSSTTTDISLNIEIETAENPEASKKVTM